MRELTRLSVRELRVLASNRGRNFRDCTEKSELVQRLIDANVVQLVKEAPPKSLDVDEAEIRATKGCFHWHLLSSRVFRSDHKGLKNNASTLFKRDLEER